MSGFSYLGMKGAQPKKQIARNILAKQMSRDRIGFSDQNMVEVIEESPFAGQHDENGESGLYDKDGTEQGMHFSDDEQTFDAKLKHMKSS